MLTAPGRSAAVQSRLRCEAAASVPAPVSAPLPAPLPAIDRSQPMTHPLDASLDLQLAGEHLFTGTTSPAYANMVGPYGGLTAAQLLRHPRPAPTLSTSYSRPCSGGSGRGRWGEGPASRSWVEAGQKRQKGQTRSSALFEHAPAAAPHSDGRAVAVSSSGRGTAARSSVPPAGPLKTSSVPPTVRRRSAMPSMPTPLKPSRPPR